MSTLHQLYRYYDKDDVLLYVGISANAVVRMTNHKACAHWYPEFRTLRVENYESRVDLERAELYVISTERPLHNNWVAAYAASKTINSDNPTYSDLVQRAIWHLDGISQAKLGEEITKIRSDGKAATQSSVSRWLTRNERPSHENILCIHKLTGGEISVLDFYPHLKEHCHEAKRAAIKKKAA